MKRTLSAVVAVLVILPASASAQGIGLGARVGTLGLGGEVAVGILPKIGLRGGVGVIPLEYNSTYSDVEYTVEPPPTIANIGIDFTPGLGGFRLSAGMIFKKDITFHGEYAGEDVNFGGNTYSGSEVGTVTGTLDHSSTAPYVTLGFGRRVGPGFGFFADLGAAFLGEPDLLMEADGEVATNPATRDQFREDLEEERQAIEEDLQGYTKILPIISIGVRIGLR